MNKNLKKLLLVVLLIIFWIVLNEEVNKTIMLYGVSFSIIIVYATQKIVFTYEESNIRYINPLSLMLFFSIVLIEICMSAVKHVVRIIKNEGSYKVFKVDLDVENIYIKVLISNAITLTPGTITLGIDNNSLNVLGFVREDESIDEIIKGILKFQAPFLLFKK